MPHFLLKSQQNEVFEAIQEKGFDPSDFQWETRTGDVNRYETIPVIVHTPTSGAFLFDFDEDGKHWAMYAPGTEKPMDQLCPGTWPNQLQSVRQWLMNLAREYHAPNLWEELQKERELADAIGPAEAEDNTPFSVEEQHVIAGQLHEIKELLVRTEQLNGERARALEARIDYLEDASTRMGRRDWLAVFYGSVFSWTLTALISPDGARQAIFAAVHGVGHLFGGDLPQLPA